jgi:hypothetical protein
MENGIVPLKELMYKSLRRESNEKRERSECEDHTRGRDS